MDNVARIAAGARKVSNEKTALLRAVVTKRLKTKMDDLAAIEAMRAGRE